MAISFRMTVGVMLILGTIAGLLSAQPAKPGPAAAKPERKLGRFSKQGWDPPEELRFSDFGIFSEDYDEYEKALAKGETHEQIAAARVLWEGHSRLHATSVLKFLAGSPLGGDDFRKLQRDVEASLQLQAILHELKEGDYLWGCWLAFLRPHKDLVPTLVAGLKNQPDMLAETVLALGNSGDPKAKPPLVELLKSKDIDHATYAASALGYLGGAETELLEVLVRKDDRFRVFVCSSLGRTGSQKALPALEKLAKEDKVYGAFNVKRIAEEAIESIKKREKK